LKEKKMKVRLCALTLSFGVATALSGAAYAQNDGSTALPQGAAGTGLSNQSLISRVRYALVTAGDIDVSRITVRAKDGHVFLEGTVPESGQIDRAALRVENSGDVKTVTNYLTIRVSGRGS
jgi:hyperosmotically inducible periplasmic protein